MGVFEFVLLIVLISTFGKVLQGRTRRVERHREEPRLPPPEFQELQELRETLERMDERLGRIEEERDFYRKLLEDPRRKSGDLPSP
jgi:hypothetical protein